MAEIQWQKVKEIFDAAMRQKPEERQQFINQVCGSDKNLLTELESLVSSLGKAENFMETPAFSDNAGTKILKEGFCFGHYEIIKQIGVGGMGEVYLAKDKKLDRKVAVKILNEKYSRHEANLQRFMREAKAASSFNHPNILIIHEIGESDRAHYIVSEYIEGETLREIIQKSPMKISEVLDIAIQITNALAVAHTAHIVHRDIKPENIIIRPDGYVKILDFGLAKLVEQQKSFISLEDATSKQNETAKGIIMGTVNYMSPEQAKGEKIDERTDIFSLGVVLYEMIAGRTPFAGNSMAETYANLINQEPRPLTYYKAEIPEQLQIIAAKMLNKNIKERFQTMKNVLLDLSNFKKQIDFAEEFENTKSPNQTSETVKLLITNEQNKSPQNENSIAILPFKNLNGDPASQFYEFSLADAVTTELARLRSLIVRPSSVIAKYQGRQIEAREAGREMRVNSVLSAAFIHSGTRLRVTAQLLDVSTGDIIWSDRIDSDANDIFALQDTITQRILDGLKFDLTTGEREHFRQRPTDNNEAYEEYLRGRDKFVRFIFRTLSPADCNAAIDSFKRAVELDPKFALAWSGLGACYANKVFKAIGDLQDYDFAETAFEKALALDPNISEVRVLTGIIYLARGEKKKARAELARAYNQLPNDAAVYFLKALIHRLDGEYDESLRSLDRLERLDPSSTVLACWNRARIYSLQGDNVRALKELDCGAVVEPNHPLLKVLRAQILFYKGEVGEAARILKKVLAENPHLEGVRPLLAMSLAAQNKFAAARKNLSERALKTAYADYDIAYWAASAYALLGEKDAAFKWLEHSVKLGMEDLKWMENDKTLDSLRGENRYAELLEHIVGQRV